MPETILEKKTDTPITEPVAEQPEPSKEAPAVPEEPVKEQEELEPEADFSLTDEGELVIHDKSQKPKEPAGEAPYTPEEIRDIGLDKLDPNRIPKELLPFYKSMQADYTRKTQALKEREKQLETVLTQPQYQPQTQQQPQVQPQLTEQQAKDLFFQAAKDRAVALLGIKAEDFDEYDARHMSYLTVASNELYAMAQEELKKQREFQEKKNKYDQLLETVKKDEPHYDEINMWASAYLEGLPYKEYAEYMRIFHTGTIEEIDGAIQRIRKAWYREKESARPKSAPPVVESGSAAVEEPKKRISGKAFGKMTPEQQAEYLRTNGYVQG